MTSARRPRGARHQQRHGGRRGRAPGPSSRSARPGSRRSSVTPPTNAHVMPLSKPSTMATATPTAKTRSGLMLPTWSWVSTLDSRMAARTAPTAGARTLIWSVDSCSVTTAGGDAPETRRRAATATSRRSIAVPCSPPPAGPTRPVGRTSQSPPPIVSGHARRSHVGLASSRSTWSRPALPGQPGSSRPRLPARSTPTVHGPITPACPLHLCRSPGSHAEVGPAASERQAGQV